jgi:hypothetical protein
MEAPKLLYLGHENDLSVGKKIYYFKNLENVTDGSIYSTNYEEAKSIITAGLVVNAKMSGKSIVTEIKSENTKYLQF